MIVVSCCKCFSFTCVVVPLLPGDAAMEAAALSEDTVRCNVSGAVVTAVLKL